MLKKINKYYQIGKAFLNNEIHASVKQSEVIEISKTPSRSEVINYLIDINPHKDLIYLEIGVRNPDHNFNKINAPIKYSVDPGIEYKENPVDFKMTSDVFFSKLKSNEILNSKIRFDIIFIDGLHLADQAYRDIENALQFIKHDGFVVIHDCNPPSEYHAREDTLYKLSPAGENWNGTTWKAFLKVRENSSIYSCCIDSDWGIGILSKTIAIGETTTCRNPFYEFYLFNAHRKESLNLVTFQEFKQFFVKYRPFINANNA